MRTDNIFYVNKQLPEALVEKEREVGQKIKEIKQKEDTLPMENKNED